MEETPLEKIVVPCFESINEGYKEKFWHRNCKYITIKNVRHYVAVPWFCGSVGGNHKDNSEEDDVCFKEFLQDPCYFYKCMHNGLRTEYVVTPCFYALIPHEKSCENPAVCGHTFNYMVYFLMQSEKEQLGIIESLVRKKHYSDRLQFLWLKTDDEQKANEGSICSINSSPDFKLNAKKFFYIASTQVEYSVHRSKGIERLNEESLVVFENMLKLFSKGVSRNDFVRQLGNKFGSILQHILRLEHNKKTNL